MEETQRQCRINSLIQRELAIIFNQYARSLGQTGVFVSVTKVSITIDLSMARVYLSIFPTAHREAVLKEIIEVKNALRHKLAMAIKEQLRKTPSLDFFKDDTLDTIEALDQSLKGTENPIEDRSLLSKRRLI